MKLTDISQFMSLFEAACKRKTIQRNLGTLDAPRWVDIDRDVQFEFAAPRDFYRVKPEAKLRPWTCDEIIHLVGQYGQLWVKSKSNHQCVYAVVAVDPSTVSIGNIQCKVGFQPLMVSYLQLDGTPCGVMEDAQ